MKRLFDMAGSLVLLVFASPLIVLVALLIKLESKGPVLFKQERVGRYGRVFDMYKFRSMVVDAAGQGPYFTRNNDPRITRLGTFIRKTSIDELPQLFNVAKGDMSLVGPRPNVPVQYSGYTQEQWDKRNSVRPGITGLAQAELRSAATADQRTYLDLEYVDKASLVFDIWIILLTVKQVLITKGGN
jgi:lipopolysaccharide/colanic/teichoic acid biosynthesis glycosyltransferase